MRQYLITMTQLVHDEDLDFDDANDGLVGTHRFLVDADDREAALDQFHEKVAIANLENYDIEVEIYRDGQNSDLALRYL